MSAYVCQNETHAVIRCGVAVPGAVSIEAGLRDGNVPGLEDDRAQSDLRGLYAVPSSSNRGGARRRDLHTREAELDLVLARDHSVLIREQRVDGAPGGVAQRSRDSRDLYWIGDAVASEGRRNVATEGLQTSATWFSRVGLVSVINAKRT